MTRRVEHLLIGGGIASASCATALAAAGAEDVLLVGRELDPPYHRPPITKGVLRGAEHRDTTVIGVPDGVEVLTRTSVMALDIEARVAKLSTKEEVHYGSVLVATGAMVRRLTVEGTQLAGIHYLRALGNADTLRADVEGAERIVCIGGSYIGCEVAASLTTMGKAVTIVMLEDEPMQRGFGGAVGRWVRSVLEAHGVEVLGGTSVAALHGDERVQAVLLEDGRSVPADGVVCGTGATPDVMLARKAGLEIGELGGVRCDAALRASAAGVFAAGDMCEYESALHGGPVRIEHEEVAAAQGRTAARGMLGDPVAHVEVPYFWTDLADWASLEALGAPAGWDEEELEGSLEEGTFVVRQRAKGRLVGAILAGGAGDQEEIKAQLLAAV